MCAVVMIAGAKKKVKVAVFPDGTPIPEWFTNTEKVDVETLGKKYVVTDYGVKNDSNVIQTEQLQAVIDKAAEEPQRVPVLQARHPPACVRGGKTQGVRPHQKL